MLAVGSLDNTVGFGRANSKLRRILEGHRDLLSR